MTLPLLVFDTNILMEVLLKRDGANASLLISLAEAKKVELVVPEYVLLEFRGTALRWIRGERERVATIRRAASEWLRSAELDKPAAELQAASKTLDENLNRVELEIDSVVSHIRSAAKVEPHTADIHFRGDLRYLAGEPPDRPVDGLKDCRIYEAILAIARSDKAATRPLKAILTRDSDFNHPKLIEELSGLGFVLRRDPGQVFGECR